MRYPREVALASLRIDCGLGPLGTPRLPATASAFACRLACANPRRRTRSRRWLALCEPPTAEAFAIRLGLLRLPLKGGVILGRSPSSSRRGANAASKRDAHPGTRASRPHHVRHGLGHLRHSDRPGTAPWVCFGLAVEVAVHRLAPFSTGRKLSASQWNQA